MSRHVVESDRIAPQPWKNAGGSTRELLAWPDAAAWRLRISVARIERDGPFSAYDDIARWFAVIDGAGVVLMLPQGRVRLDVHSKPLHFDGALAPRCELVNGPTTDLNLMVRRDAGEGGMSIALPDEEWVSAAPWRALFAADAATLQVDHGDVVAVRAGTLVWSAEGARERWRVRPQNPSATRAWWIHFQPRAAIER